ncbi:MAG: hypothetical protein AAGI45_22260 [Cyanobacteria bacterium P01_H01_bin.26]
MHSTVIAQLEQLIAQIQSSGPVADADARLDVSTHLKSGYKYARLRNGRELSACGRVGSKKYLEVLSSLQRRDKISQRMRAISSLKQADEIPVAVLEVGEVDAVSRADNALIPASSVIVSAAKPKPAAAAQTERKTKRRQQLCTHVKTKQGSVVHAVLGKDKIGEWRTAALCGATPPQRDRMGWEFPTHDDGLTCAKCYRKLPANGKRHFPVF